MTVNQKRNRDHQPQQLMHSYTDTLLQHRDSRIQECLLFIEESTGEFTIGNYKKHGEACDTVLNTNLELIEMLNSLSLKYDHHNQSTYHPWLEVWKPHFSDELLQELSQVLFMCPSTHRQEIYEKINELLNAVYLLMS